MSIETDAENAQKILESKTETPQESSSELLEIRFPKSKRYKKIRILNGTHKEYKVIVDVNETNLLLIKVVPWNAEITE